MRASGLLDAQIPLLSEGDTEGYSMWKHIASAITELTWSTRVAGEPLN